MEIEERLKKEVETLTETLSEKRVGTEEYANVLNQLKEAKKLLNEETERVNSTQRIELEKRKLEIENNKNEFDFERRQEDREIEEKRSRRANRWQIVNAGINVGGYILGAVVIMILGAALDNSGICLPNRVQKLIQMKRL